MKLVLHEHLSFLAQLMSYLLWDFDDLAQICLERQYWINALRDSNSCNDVYGNRAISWGYRAGCCLFG